MKIKNPKSVDYKQMKWRGHQICKIYYINSTTSIWLVGHKQPRANDNKNDSKPLRSLIFPNQNHINHQICMHYREPTKHKDMKSKNSIGKSAKMVPLKRRSETLKKLEGRRRLCFSNQTPNAEKAELKRLQKSFWSLNFLLSAIYRTNLTKPVYRDRPFRIVINHLTVANEVAWKRKKVSAVGCEQIQGWDYSGVWWERISSTGRRYNRLLLVFHQP